AGIRYIRFPGGSNSNEYHWNGKGKYNSNGEWVVDGSPSPVDFSSGFLNLSKYRGSTSAGYRKKAMVTDNDLNTSWKSFPGDTRKQYIILEIQNSSYQPVNVNRIVINWGTPYATQYKVQYSNANWPGNLGIWVYNDTAWKDTSSGTISGSGGDADISFNVVSAKYIRVLCDASSSPDNQFEIKEVKLYYGANQVSVNSGDPMQQTKTYSSSVALGDVFDRYGNMDFEQFMDVCRSLTPPAEALITVNFFTGNVQEAADWVYYANVHKGYNVKYWEIGNENAGNWEAGGPVDSQFYAKRFIEFYDAMTAVDSNIVVMPQFNSIGDYENVTMNASNNPVAHDYYIENFLKYIQSRGRQDIIKAISVHRYPTYQPATEAVALSYTNIWDSEMTPLTNWINTYCPVPQSVSVWLTEYNDGIDSAFTNRYYNSLFISSYVLNFVKNGGDFGFLFTDFGTPGPGQMAPDIYSDFGAMEGGALSGDLIAYRYQPRSSYWALWMLKNRFSAADELGNTLVACSSSNSSLKIYANKRGDRKLSLIMINTSETDSIDANVSLNGFSPLSSAQVVTFSPQQYSWISNGYQSYANPDMQPADSTISNASQAFSFNVPAYNVKIITLYDSTLPTLTPSSTPTALPTATFTPTPVFLGANLIDDCEDGDKTDLWGGVWSIYGDEVSAYPSLFTDMKCDGAGADGSNCYVEVTGSVMGNSWGFGLSAALSSNWSPMDLRSYDGIFFWYKGDGQHDARVFINQNNI
ncbi:MAG TPA: discoidin domain-containing protein, partial [Candidatus Goldiibacteriota bacterium]|nr:discoidin domain-containing protein [Candidatus Goldiibacteriota bacterium]